MRLKLLLLLLSFCNPALVSALSITAAIQLPPNDTCPDTVVVNDTFLDLLSLQNATGLTAPPPPPADFEMRYSWNEKVRLKLEQVYSNTIDLMADLAVLGWNSELRTFPVTVFAGRRFTTQIVVDNLLPPL